MRNQALFLIITVSLVTTGCTNSSSKKRTPNTATSTSSPTTFIEISRAVFSPDDLSQTQLLTDASFSAVCGGGSSPITCRCILRYGDETRSDPPTLVEPQLLRCPLTGLSAQASSAYIHLVQTETEQTSNELPLNLAELGLQSGLASDQTYSYLPIQRILCKDTVTLPHLWSPNVYDPFLSENPKLAPPLNFYTNSIAKTIEHLSGNWECTSQAEPAKTWAHWTLFSRTPASDTSGYTISDATGKSTARALFYLAKKPFLPFTAPVNAYIAPGKVTLANSDRPPIGYGVKPITANGNERCPTSSEVRIPSGFHWVKVWAFRTTLEPRRVIQKIKAIDDVEQIACNPGRFSANYTDSNDTNEEVIADCSFVSNATYQQRGVNGPGGIAIDDPVRGTLPASRVITTKNQTGPYCVNLVATGPARNSTGGAKTKYAGLFPPGLDLWVHAGNNTGATSANAPLNLSRSLATTQDDDGFEASQNPLANTRKFKAPYESSSQFTFGVLPGDSAKSEYVFVVSPPDVTKKEMVQKTGNRFALYYPYRTYLKDDCPSATSPLGCPENRVLSYDIWLSDLAADLNKNSGNPAETFPICALQPEENTP